jgi:hypothetical protein
VVRGIVAGRQTWLIDRGSDPEHSHQDLGERVESNRAAAYRFG